MHIFRGFIAEMLAGPQSVALFTPQILDYLISNLDPEVHPSVILFSLIALEKFSQTSENKGRIFKNEILSKVSTYKLVSNRSY